MVCKVNQLFEYEFDISQNLQNNLRVLCHKDKINAKRFIPEKYFNEINNGNVIPAHAKYYSPSTNKYYELDFAKVLSDQIGYIINKDSKKSEIPVIQIDIEGYGVAPDGSLAVIENKTLPIKMEKTELDTNKVDQNNPKDTNDLDKDERNNLQNEGKKEDRGGIGQNIKKLRIIVCVLVFLIMGTVTWWLTKDTSVKDCISYLENDNYKEAINLYNESINGNYKKEEKVNSLIEMEINQKFEQYCQDISTYDSTMSILGTISEIKNSALSELAKSKVNMVSNLEDSKEIDIIILEAEELALKEDYEGALVKIQIGLVTYPKSVELKNKVNEYTEVLNIQSRKKTLVEAKSLADSGDYVSALALIKKAQEDQGDNVEYQNAFRAYSTAYKSEVIASADALAINGDYGGAFEAVSTAIAVTGEDSELVAKSQNYESAYTESVLEQVNNYLNEHNFMEAENLLENAISKFPDNKVISNKRVEVDTLSINAGIIKTYSGTYQGYSGGLSILRGFDLEIVSCDKNGSIEAIFSCYSVDGSSNLFASYEMKGNILTRLNDGSVVISLSGTEWIVRPDNFSMIMEANVTINADKTILTSEEREMYGVDINAIGLYNYSDILKTYSGTYVTSWGVSCLDLIILSCDENTGNIEAEFYFYPHKHNPGTKTGRFKMSGKITYVYQNGTVKIGLKGYEWIEKPENTGMLDFFYITINGERDKVNSDSYQINLTA